jgi:hypothetical protein
VQAFLLFLSTNAAQEKEKKVLLLTGGSKSAVHAVKANSNVPLFRGWLLHQMDKK